MSKGTPNLCKWEAIPDGPSPGRSGNNEVDLTVEGAEDDDMDEDEIPSALRTTKLDLNENREMLKILRKRIQNLKDRVVSTTGPAPAPVTVGPRGPSMSLEALGAGLSCGSGSQVEGMHPTGPLVGASPGASTRRGPGGIGSYEYVPSTPGSVPLYDVPSTTTATSAASRPSQSSQVHVPVKPQAPRSYSKTSFNVASAFHDERYSRMPPFALVHPGEFVGRGNTSSILHSVSLDPNSPRLQSVLLSPLPRYVRHQLSGYPEPN